jgi:hypothetical protein
VREDDIHKTTIQALDGLTELVAMPPGLCNAQAKFHWMMNDILRDILRKFVTVDLDDTCVYIRTLEKHLQHLLLQVEVHMERGLRKMSYYLVFNNIL